MEAANMSDRYSRQVLYKNIGTDGQEKLLAASVAVVGMGALGCSSASLLSRAGIGHLRLIDRDLVELSNLQRQILYTEADAAENIPKVFAAAEHLTAANSEITIEPVFSDLNPSNCTELLQGIDLVIDATDNLETRYLINEYCVENEIPWIYGGALGSNGMTADFVPGGPCFSCFTGSSKAQSDLSAPTCSTVGVLNSITNIISSIQAAEAIKILVGSKDVSKNVQFLEIWENEYINLALDKNPDCPICVKKEYQYLGKNTGTSAISMCGKNAFQVIPSSGRHPDLGALKKNLEVLGEVKESRFFLQFKSPEASFKLFPDGRAIIENVSTPGKAKSIYSEYIGL